MPGAGAERRLRERLRQRLRGAAAAPAPGPGRAVGAAGAAGAGRAEEAAGTARVVPRSPPRGPAGHKFGCRGRRGWCREAARGGCLYGSRCVPPPLPPVSKYFPFISVLILFLLLLLFSPPLHTGKSLKTLMSKGILQVHPPICDCPGCRISSPVVRLLLNYVLWLRHLPSASFP